MRFMIMHKTNAYWETGAIPSPELIARVEALLGELARAGVLLGAEGLRSSSQGVRLRFSGGARTVINGPLEGGNELPAGFSIIRTQSLGEAIEWASQHAEALGEDIEVDIRPVTEAWDIGMEPSPAHTSTRRYMVLRKATAATEAGAPPPSARGSDASGPIEGAAPANVHIVTETMRPSAKGRRYKNSHGGIRVLDGPFVESKEMVGGYIIVSAESLADVDRLARMYIDAVGADEVDVRELE